MVEEMDRFPRLSALRNWRAGLVKDLNGDVLEIGVGTGPNLRYYHRAERVRAIEPGLARAEEARRSGVAAGANVAVEVAPAEQLPYADDSFDHVVCSLVFCSVDDQRQALAEIRRVLKPEGTLQMVEHVRPRNRFWGGLFRALTPGWRRVAKNCHLDRKTVDLLRHEGWDVNVRGQFLVFVRLSATYRALF